MRHVSARLAPLLLVLLTVMVAMPTHAQGVQDQKFHAQGVQDQELHAQSVQDQKLHAQGVQDQTLYAQSGSRMDGAAFDAYTRGQTFTYGTGAEPYGAEEYLEGRRVRWSFLDGRCQEGEWYEENGMICFVYDDNPDPQCWSFYQTPRGIVARFEDDPTQTTLYEITRSAEPLMCLGPEVGT